MSRRIVLPIVRVAVGAVVSVLIAWACAIWAPSPPAAAVMPVPMPPGEGWPRPAPEGWPPPQAVTRASSRLVSLIGTVATQAPADGKLMYLQTLLQYGWPLRCLEMEARQVRPAQPAAELIGAGGRVPSWSPPDHRDRRLPLRPIWGGLVVDTLAVTVLLWLLELLVTLRWTLRRWRGRCTRCGYDLRGVAHDRCPECGRAVITPAPRTEP